MPDTERQTADWTADLRKRIDELIDEYRAALHDSLDGLTEQEARRSLVPSKTTLLGLVKHVTFVEGVWFDQAVTGRSYAEIGIASTVNGSFALRRTDTIASVQAAYRDRCEASRRNLDGLQSDDVVDGRGPRAVWALQLQVLRELAQHAGHADILREQVLAGRTPDAGPDRTPSTRDDVAAQRLRLEAGLAAVAEWEAENGPLTAQEIADGTARAQRQVVAEPTGSSPSSTRHPTAP